MTTALSQIYWYFPVDAASPIDISTDELQLSLDQVTWITAVYEASPPAGIVTAAGSAPSGFTRFWWRALSGPGNPLPLVYGKQYVHGQLTDTPEVPYFAWIVNVPQD